ncbi:MAG TPA: hypothetical protein VNR64_21285 [Vicinamibacterales bacterium]|nr:hypothetical protein [Vicinamibacterales bacterium]
MEAILVVACVLAVYAALWMMWKRTGKLLPPVMIAFALLLGALLYIVRYIV